MSALSICFNRPLPYAEAMALQDKLVAARIAGTIPDTVLFLEHPPVITLGVRAHEDNLLLPPEELARRNIDVVKTSRGGDVTWHGPGQLIMYPVMKLGKHEAGAHGYLHCLEEIAVRTAYDFGVSAFRRKGLTGAWTDSGKLAAIGIRFKRWIAFHGMSFNVDPDLSGFDAIVPCGLAGEYITSLRSITGEKCPAIEKVRERMIEHFGNVCRRQLRPCCPADIAGIIGNY